MIGPRIRISSMRSSLFTIGQVMVGIAVFASLLAVPRLAVSPDRIVMVCLVGLLTVLVLLNMLVEMVFGKLCPSCSRWTLRRLARHRRYYRRPVASEQANQGPARRDKTPAAPAHPTAATR
jgi:hypothetical protein